MQAVKYVAATGNSSFGYFGGGFNPAISGSRRSTVDRIDYANDTATASPKGPLSAVKNSLAATSAASNALPTDNGLLTIFNLATDTRDNVVPQGFDTGYFSGGSQPAN